MTNLDSILKSLVKAMVLCRDVRAGPLRKQNTKELMLLNCGVGEDS